VFVLIAVAFLHQDIGLDGPTMPSPEVTTLVKIVCIERAAGDPGMPRGLLDELSGTQVDLFPTFLTDHHMKDLFLAPVVAVPVLDIVDPPEVLPARAPVLLPMLLGQNLDQPVDLFPHRRQRIVLQHDHEIPVVAAT